MKITIIGGGNMGEAFASSLLVTGITSRAQLCIVEQSQQRRKQLSKLLRCSVKAAAAMQMRQSKVVILAVKPQDSRIACESIRPHLRRGQLVISIMAGVTIASLKKALMSNVTIVRCMPSLPARIRLGIAVYYAHPKIPVALRRRAQLVLGATGVALALRRESLLNATTALSGSGPAYVFYLIEHLILAARRLGFSGVEAQELVYHTLRGATELWKQSGVDARTLRQQVTSKKGTTDAAFREFERRKVGESLQIGIRAALKRARQLAAFAY